MTDIDHIRTTVIGQILTGHASSAASNRLGDVRAARALQRWIRGIVSIQARWRGDCVRACQYLRRLASVPADRRVEALAVIRRRVAYRARMAAAARTHTLMQSAKIVCLTCGRAATLLAQSISQTRGVK